MKRRALKLLLFLLAGAIINIAVAWLFAAWAPMNKWSQTIHGAFNQDDETWRVLEMRQWGATQIWWAADIRYDLRGNELQLSPEEKLVVARRQVEIDSKSDRNRVTRNAPPEFGSFHEPIPSGVLHGTDRAFGWPQRSLWNKVSRGSGILGFESSARLEGGLRLDQGSMFDFRALPLRPIWPGFAINTIFYAAVLWLLFYGSGKVRRFVRVRRHRCPACGFIIAPRTCANGLCSECGSALPWLQRSRSVAN